jgi:hypothetical protein
MDRKNPMLKKEKCQKKNAAKKLRPKREWTKQRLTNKKKARIIGLGPCTTSKWAGLILITTIYDLMWSTRNCK